MTPDPPPADDDTADLDESLEAIHEHLAATQELPVERTPSRWIGEAEAVAADLATADLDAPVVRERLGHVRSLLSEVETTGDDAADDHLSRARSVTETAIDRLDGD
ncbi:hypothetical protein L593_14345 [Salinarchaeum sp. Harcht-Bsk1]|uniref:hypothetical protein n=1 Tax=Salinarchaeum sp. Harcht-Bsk1 TaxID=1333523 RepID=UPI00034235EA|nr:hypothetical protein [Salinarchaeum sp. Harcht-Bsk1]AGN02808.1 hypothetical protein L593_14345 [Salinarchaeum sp. Harcht-Bsk1]